MKKLIVLALAGAAGVFVKRFIDQENREASAWKAATDPVKPAS